jgi:FtsP/CotA-like multicopper oxidase with cupredoxin domain
MAATPVAEPRILRVTKSGYDGQIPGPELRVKRGEEFAVRVVNELSEPTAVHWHGVRLANAMDGAPPLTQAPIAPGESFDYHFIAPDAGTFYYHPPISNYYRTPLSNDLDLCGALIVEDTKPVDVDHDVTLMVVDGALTLGGKPMRNGFALNTNNSQTVFEIRARANERLRLRFVNAAETLLQLRIDNLPVFVMATDGQPAQPFAPWQGRLSLGPGNRIDVFADCTLMPGGVAPISVAGVQLADIPIGKVVCEGTNVPGRTALRAAPNPLPPSPLPERMDLKGALRAEASVGGKVGAPIFTIKHGRTVVLGLSNPTSDRDALIHLHGHSFRLLDDRDDGWKPFWLDTMPIAPRGKARIAFVADNPGKWLIEGLATQNGAGVWFEVT